MFLIGLCCFQFFFNVDFILFGENLRFNYLEFFIWTTVVGRNSLLESNILVVNIYEVHVPSVKWAVDYVC